MIFTRVIVLFTIFSFQQIAVADGKGEGRWVSPPVIIEHKSDRSCQKKCLGHITINEPGRSDGTYQVICPWLGDKCAKPSSTKGKNCIIVGQADSKSCCDKTSGKVRAPYSTLKKAKKKPNLTIGMLFNCVGVKNRSLSLGIPPSCAKKCVGTFIGNDWVSIWDSTWKMFSDCKTKKLSDKFLCGFTGFKPGNIAQGIMNVLNGAMKACGVGCKSNKRIASEADNQLRSDLRFAINPLCAPGPKKSSFGANWGKFCQEMGTWPLNSYVMANTAFGGNFLDTMEKNTDKFGKENLAKLMDLLRKRRIEQMKKHCFKEHPTTKVQGWEKLPISKYKNYIGKNHMNHPPCRSAWITFNNVKSITGSAPKDFIKMSSKIQKLGSDLRSSEGNLKSFKDSLNSAVKAKTKSERIQNLNSAIKTYKESLSTSFPMLKSHMNSNLKDILNKQVLSLINNGIKENEIKAKDLFNKFQDNPLLTKLRCHGDCGALQGKACGLICDAVNFMLPTSFGKYFQGMNHIRNTSKSWGSLENLANKLEPKQCLMGASKVPAPYCNDDYCPPK